MPIEFSEDVLQNDNFSATTDESGNLVLEHKQTGGQFKFDATKNRWIPVQGVDLEGSDVDNVGTMDATDVTTDDATVNNLLSAENAEVTALEADKTTTTRTFQDVTSSRSVNTAETNNTGSDIEVYVTLESQSDEVEALTSVDIDGSTIMQPLDNRDSTNNTLDTGERFGFFFSVNDGSDYEVVDNSGDLSVKFWTELKP